MPLRVACAILFLLAAPPVLADPSTNAPAASLPGFQQILDKVISNRTLARARLAVQVIDAQTGKSLYSRNPDALLNPASNVKLFTSAAALVRLGHEWRFDTEFLMDAQPSTVVRTGKAKGNLYVRGKGDPSITTDRLWLIVNDMWYKGLRSITGNIVLDDSYFDSESVGPGFDQEHSDRPYMAPAGALSLNYNTVGIHVYPGNKSGAPAKIRLDPGCKFFTVRNRVKTSSHKNLRHIIISTEPWKGKQRIVVSGTIPLHQPPASFWRKIDYPTWYFGNTFLHMLKKRGINVKGKIVRGKTPFQASLFHYYQSDTLDIILKRVNKLSSNFAAEQLIKTMGAQRTNAAGSWEAGIRAVEDFLATEVGIPGGTFIMKNGSGLNDTNRFSASQICKLLHYMWNQFSYAPEFVSSLGIAGVDGTLHSRMEGSPAQRRLRAKTGTLGNVSALAGYVQTLQGRTLAFAVMANDFPGRARPVARVFDSLGIALASFGQKKVPDNLAATPQEKPIDVEQSAKKLQARIRLYASLANKADPRNTAFFRTILHTEKDLALRAIVAEALYRLHPDDQEAQDEFLDHLEINPLAFGQLRIAARTHDFETPVLPSLLQIAGEGNKEALRRLLKIASWAIEDDSLAQEIIKPFDEVARNTPNELILAFQTVRKETEKAALDFLAKAIIQSAQSQEHPFTNALQKSQKSLNKKLATYAKKLDERLSIRMASEKIPRNNTKR